ncbi:unnamed protein product [Rhizophagus irregularis]|uniref:Uncharacterized protein n=1 Tax=Rhizophagus irregularis TaxID=588596 RepID=A0A915YXT9_9GLOM|nr:unnamed protein product [Rhizophagus irregularis]CAB5349637.1 unnamed protein product [Rhizophagus irregularis]
MSLSDIEFISDNETINSQSDEECNDDNEDFLAYFTKKFSVNTIIHTSVPIEYPRTSPTGVATIYNITGWSNPLACFSDIQYSINGSGGGITLKDCPFLGTSVKKNEPAQESTCKFKSNNVQCTGKATLRKVKCNGTLVVTYIIECEKYVSGEKWHRYMKIPDDIDLISLLRNLFNGSHIPEIENNECKTIFPLNSRRKTCDFFHTHNGGEVVRGKLLKNHAM